MAPTRVRAQNVLAWARVIWPETSWFMASTCTCHWRIERRAARSARSWADQTVRQAVRARAADGVSLAAGCVVARPADWAAAGTCTVGGHGLLAWLASRNPSPESTTTTAATVTTQAPALQWLLACRPGRGACSEEPRGS